MILKCNELLNFGQRKNSAIIKVTSGVTSGLDVFSIIVFSVLGIVC